MEAAVVIEVERVDAHKARYLSLQDIAKIGAIPNLNNTALNRKRLARLLRKSDVMCASLYTNDATVMCHKENCAR